MFISEFMMFCYDGDGDALFNMRNMLPNFKSYNIQCVPQNLH